MSKERARNRAAREQEAGIKAAARGAEAERKERQQAARTPKGAAGKAPGGAAGGGSGKAKTPGKGRPTPKQSAPRSPAGKKRGHAPVGRPDGPLARRRRNRIRFLVALLLVVNIAAGVLWRDWTVSLAVLIVSIISAPLLAAALLRRH